ncbi:LytTR family DNA-binding domain-containing protein [Tateyamaria sp. SN3-11]|uniref:LytTR family DNA-binding domain-containing protein n=1 Tax=Tateyamaria sp. SN3-11 TaxID=3092147 RepID=UPI0039EB16A9
MLLRIEAALTDAGNEILGVKPPSFRGLLKGALIAVCWFGFIVACFEPEPTASLSFGTSILVWITYFSLGAVILIGSTTLMTLLSVKPFTSVVIAIVALPILIAPFSLVVEYVADADSAEAFRDHQYLRLFVNEVMEVAPPSIAIGTLLAWLAYRTGELAKGYRYQVLDKLRPEPKLHELFPEIPDRLGSDIIRAEAQDHYVYFVCADGTATVKVKFSDVQERLKPMRGLQCHRSHWVRLRHVKKIVRTGSAYVCELSNGDVVPISRRRYSELKNQK